MELKARKLENIEVAQVSDDTLVEAGAIILAGLVTAVIAC